MAFLRPKPLQCPFLGRNGGRGGRAAGPLRLCSSTRRVVACTNYGKRSAHRKGRDHKNRRNARAHPPRCAKRSEDGNIRRIRIERREKPSGKNLTTSGGEPWN